jgi:hypothetical protein
LASECTSTITPSITVRNSGTATVTAYQVGYILNNGAPVIPANTYGPIAPGATQTIVFANPINVPTGTHTIRLFTTNPDGQPDLFPSNDTITRIFTVRQLFTTVSENFDAPVFPPPTMTIINPNANVTWTRDVPGRSSPGGV